MTFPLVHRSRSKSGGIGENVMSVRFAVIFEQAEHNWAAYVPDLPGCITTGSTLEETECNIREAIEGHLQTLSEYGDPIPRPTTVEREIEIQSAA
jgi:predicted RNase H-like HicB family nuclease